MNVTTQPTVIGAISTTIKVSASATTQTIQSAAGLITNSFGIGEDIALVGRVHSRQYLRDTLEEAHAKRDPNALPIATMLADLGL